MLSSSVMARKNGRHARWASGPRAGGPTAGARRIVLIVSCGISPRSPAAADRISGAFVGPGALPAGSNFADSAFASAWLK